MQKVLKRHMKVLISVLAGAILMLCSIAASPTLSSIFSESQTTNEVVTTCSGSCHSHTQVSGTNRFEDQKDDDDKEPTPPLDHFSAQTASLIALYTAPIVTVIALFLLYRKHHLSTQLRF